jgi:short-subunit dehydrogenase
MARIAAQGIEVDGLINNAGFGLHGAFATLDGPKQSEMISLNCLALTELCHAVLPGMIASKHGQILNVASTAAFQAGPNMAVYYASKAYVLSFSEALHEEVKAHGVHVTALCPGPTATEFFDTANAGSILLTKLMRKEEPVVDDGLRALKANKAIVISGIMNKLTAHSARFVPRAFTRKLAQSLQR